MKQQHFLHSFAKELRNNCTDAERLLWRHLRNSQLEDVKFRRQQPIEAYIVDFVSFEKSIVIELDGGQHAENAVYDQQRDVCLQRNGFIVLRFWNNEIFENIDGVLEVIRQHCLEATFPHPPTPSRQGRGSIAIGETMTEDQLEQKTFGWLPEAGYSNCSCLFYLAVIAS